MPKPPLPPELDQFLAQPNPAVIATLRPDGSPHTAATWYLWEGGRMLVNMDESRKRLDYLRSDPRASITVMGQENWYYHVSLSGRAISLGSAKDIQAEFLRILTEFRSRYLLSFAPQGVPDTGYHRLTVRAKKRGVTVTARPGYTTGAARVP